MNSGLVSLPPRNFSNISLAHSNIRSEIFVRNRIRNNSTSSVFESVFTWIQLEGFRRKEVASRASMSPMKRKWDRYLEEKDTEFRG